MKRIPGSVADSVSLAWIFLELPQLQSCYGFNLRLILNHEKIYMSGIVILGTISNSLPEEKHGWLDIECITRGLNI